MSNCSVAVTGLPVRDLAYLQGQLTAQYLAKSRYTLVHYDVTKKEISAYAWPVMLYYALKPPLWQEHRVTHEFRFPCCLCPARSFGGDGKYKETQVEKGVEGHYTGKWVATCAQRSCPYFACLDDFVGKPWIGTRDYSLRAPPVSEGDGPSTTKPKSRPASQTGGSKRTKGHAIRFALMHTSYGVGGFNLWKLDRQSRPGLTAPEFYKLFTECRCGMIMTRRAFRSHHCRFIVVDLTNDSDCEIIDLTLTDSKGKMVDGTDDDEGVLSV